MRKRIALSVLVVVLVSLAVWVYWANTAVELNTVTVKEANLPAGFDGFRIAHLSDVHSASFYMDVVELLQEAEPDIICITGDLMDHRDASADTALALVREAVKIAPCYYVTGNHEVALPEGLYRDLMDGLVAAGVTVLEDSAVGIAYGGDEISLAGHGWGDVCSIANIRDLKDYRILLSHVPEEFHLYTAAGFDLVLSGHAHGGQFRLPFIGGLYAPGEGFFPKYEDGHHTNGRTDMVVSRGIGNSTIPVRFNNRPEVILIILEVDTSG